LSERSFRRHQAVTLSLLFLAGIVNFLDRSSLSIANTTVRAEMHLNATQMGWLLSAFSFAYGLAQLPLIGLLDRVGTRAVLGGGLVVWSAAQMLTGFVRTLPQFLVLRVLLGTGEAPFYPSGIRSTREWFSAETRGRATAVMSSSQTIGLSFAPPVLTWIMLRMGWRGMFIVLGVAGLGVAAAWIAFHRARKDTEFAEPEEVQLASDLDEPAWRVLIRQRAVWGMMLGWGGVNYTVWLYLAWLPAYLQEQRHLSLAKSGALSDWLAKRGKPLTTIHRRNLIVGMVASAAGTFLVAHSGSTAQAVAGISAALFFIHFGGTSGWGYVQAISPLRYVASLGALQNFASFMIASAAPVVTGWLLDRTHSFTLALGVCSAVTLLGALSYATLAAPSGMRIEQKA
jgi:MFS family permease